MTRKRKNKRTIGQRRSSSDFSLPEYKSARAEGGEDAPLLEELRNDIDDNDASLSNKVSKVNSDLTGVPSMPNHGLVKKNKKNSTEHYIKQW